jgi:hypothetical protein
MQIEQATAALGALAGVTTGWNDSSVEGYLIELVKLENPEALMAACHRLSVTWEEARRPPLAAITNLYHREAMRLEAPALPSRQRTIPPRQGVEVARDAYVKECRRIGQRVDMDHFDAVMAPIVNRMTDT